MALKFTKLNKAAIKKLEAGKSITEHGIKFERLPSGDGKFSVNIMVDGQRIHRIIGKESDGVTRTQVEDYIAKLRTDARVGRLSLPKGRKTILGFSQAGTSYLKKLSEEGGKDIPKKKERIKCHLSPFFKNKPLSSVTTFDIERYKKLRTNEKASPGTINRELAVMSHIFSKAMEWRWINYKSAIIRRLKEDVGRICYLDTEEMEKLLIAAKEDKDPHLFPFILIGLETSMRHMEILSIQVKNIDLGKRVIYIPKAKAGAREQPITKNLANFLGELLNSLEPNQQYLFPSRKSYREYRGYMAEPFRRAVEKAKLEHKVPHIMRHTAITHLVQEGIDLPTVQRISGHKTLSMVAKYAHQNGQHIQAAMDKLEERYKAI